MSSIWRVSVLLSFKERYPKKQNFLHTLILRFVDLTELEKVLQLLVLRIFVLLIYYVSNSFEIFAFLFLLFPGMSKTTS